MARAGTIAEYGYVMIGDEGRIRDAVSPVLAELGDEADPQALRRARIESNILCCQSRSGAPTFLRRALAGA